MRIEKIDRIGTDEDGTTTTIIEAESLEALGRAETAVFLVDDRFCPCYGYSQEFETHIKNDQMSIEWSPGDGGVYTVAEYRVLDHVCPFCGQDCTCPLDQGCGHCDQDYYPPTV